MFPDFSVQKYIQFSVFAFIPIFFLLSFSSCTKAEGPGGKATITGKLFKIKGSGDIEVEADESVYIIYGKGGIGYDDDVKTSYDGTYKFEYLRKGDYTIFSYTDCDDANDFESCIETIEVSIARGDKIVQLDSLIID